jgi:hypothetical protein
MIKIIFCFVFFAFVSGFGDTVNQGRPEPMNPIEWKNVYAHGVQEIVSQTRPGYVDVQARAEDGKELFRFTMAISGNLPEATASNGDLLKFDQRNRLTPRRASRWLQLAQEQNSVGESSQAFQYALIALEIARSPHIKLRYKDDSSLKVNAALATYESGHKSEAVEIVVRLVKSRLAHMEP